MDKNTRTIDQIGDAIISAAEKLSPDSRLAVARRMNMLFGLAIPLELGTLVDDDFWLDQIREVVNSIPEYADNNQWASKNILTSFEFMVRTDEQDE